MGVTFTKLFSSITESTVWCESADTRLVWITMLAMSDKRGRVSASIPGLANRARVPVEAVREALDKFLGPDPDSRTKDHEGRRIEEIDGGWRLLNHAKYRALRDDEDRKESKREWAQRNRAERRRGRLQSATVGQDRHNAEAEADTELHTTTLPRKRGATAKPPAAARRMDGPEGEVLRAFDAGHRAFLGLPYMAAFARDIQSLKNPLKVYGLPLMLDFVEAFWAEAKKARQNPDDATYAAGRAKPHIPGLVGQIPNLMRRYTFENRPPENPDDGHS